jgi:putative DNA primase/helicase
MNLSGSRYNFQRPFPPTRSLASADTRRAGRLLAGLDDADADAAGWFGQVLAAAYGAAETPQEEAIQVAADKHGARVTILAIDQSLSLTGQLPADVVAAAEAIAAEAAVLGTARLGPPLQMDGLEPGTSEAAMEDPAASAEQDEPVGDLVSGQSGIRDSHGEPWSLAVIPWLPVLDEQGRPQKLPAMKSWQQTLPGTWQKPDIYRDPDMPDEEDLTGMKLRVRPGRGAWRPDWEEGWLTNRRTGLWVVDIDDPALFEAAIERARIAIPQTRCQSTGRAGGMHMLFDGRNLPDEFWRQGGLGNPPWGDLKANGFVAAEGAAHPYGPVYAYLEGWPEEICEPPLDFVGWIMSEREAWRGWLNEQGKASWRTGYRNVASATGEMRNVRLCRLRGILFNRVPEMDDDEIRETLLAANEEFAEPLPVDEMESTVLLPKPGWERHPASGQPGRVLPSPGTPMRVARLIAEEDLATPQGLPSLRWHRGGFTRWDGTAWLTEADASVEQQLFLITEHAFAKAEDGEDGEDGEARYAPWNPTPGSVANVQKTLGVAVLQLPHRLDPPFWISSGTEERGLIPLGNGLLSASTRELVQHTPDFYNTWSLPYDYDPDAPEPAEWLAFLGKLWPDEPESIDFLQEYTGYLLSGDTSQEKVCLLTGPRRGGKGTICRVLIALMGARNVASPTFTNLTETFGLEPLIDKPLAIIFDARTGSKNIQSAVERMLTISGRDRVTVNRKNRAAWEGQLPTRLMHVSNELPALRDVSAALASRYIPLTTTRSWLGQEDLGLGARLTTQGSLSSILNWALDGLDRLCKQGTFTMPAGAAEALAALERLSSPEMAWAAEHAEFGPDLWARTDALFASYQQWAIEDQRMTKTPVKEVFTRNLRAAFPGLVPSRRRTGGEKQHHGYSGIKLVKI